MKCEISRRIMYDKSKRRCIFTCYAREYAQTHVNAALDPALAKALCSAVPFSRIAKVHATATTCQCAFTRNGYSLLSFILFSSSSKINPSHSLSFNLTTALPDRMNTWGHQNIATCLLSKNRTLKYLNACVKN